MTYIMSDLHGMYNTYLAMLQKIHFQDTDKLYILGDILDRGPNPIKIILDILKRSNVEVIAGNHCVMACECLPFLLQEITTDTLQKLDDEMIEKLINWQRNGAVTTTDEFHRQDQETRRKIVDFISNLELYKEVEVAGEHFILVHAGLGNFSPDKELWEYDLDELVWMRSDYETEYYKDKYVVTGHTPTQLIEGNPRPGYIYQANHHIAIDCGAGFRGGRLGCLRLDDMAEFYVDIKND